MSSLLELVAVARMRCTPFDRSNFSGIDSNKFTIVVLDIVLYTPSYTLAFRTILPQVFPRI